MKDNSDEIRVVSDRALEMIMREVLDGLFEFSLESSYPTPAEDFQILDIRPEQTRQLWGPSTTEETWNAEIIDFPKLKRAHG